MKPRRFPFRTKYLLELLKIDQGETREVHVRHHRVVGIRSDHIQRSSEGERVLRWQRRKNYFPMLRTKQTTRSFESTQMSPARVITTNFRSWLGMHTCNLVHWRRNSDKITSIDFFIWTDIVYMRLLLPAVIGSPYVWATIVYNFVSHRLPLISNLRQSSA